MNSAAAGSDACFEDLLGACLPRLRRRIERWVGRTGVIDAEDVLHDTIVRALDHRDEFATAADLMRWCTTTAHRRVWEILRSPEEVHHVAVADVTEAADANGEASPDPAELVERARDIVAVHAAMAQLPERDRVLIEAAWFRNLRQHEIAAELHMTVPKVNMLMHRARQRLRVALRPLQHLGVVPLLSWRARRALRRGLWPTQLPAPLLATGAVVVGLTAVFQYAVPGSLPAEAQEIPRTAVLEAVSDPAARTSDGAAPERTSTPSRARVIRSSDVGTPSQVTPQPLCHITCLPVSPPTPPTVSEDGDTITVHLPAGIEQQTGTVYVRENYTPVCEHWTPNPAASCHRTGDPQWTVPPARHNNPAASRPEHHRTKETK